MTIPPELQVFPLPVEVSDADAERLRPLLVPLPAMYPIMDRTNVHDLRRLVILELMGSRRWSTLYRLLARIGKIETQGAQAAVRKLCRV